MSWKGSSGISSSPASTDRRFGQLWASTAAANLGDGLLFAGLPVMASTLTTSPLRIALVQVAIFGPMLVAALPSGVAADRYDRARIMTAANLIRAAGLGGLGVLTLGGEWLLASVYAAGVLLGLFETLSDAAAQTAVPMLVVKDGLTRANSRLIGTQTVMNDGIGAPVGSVLASLGGGWLFAGPAVLYGAAGVLSARLGALVPPQPAASAADGGPPLRRSVRQEIVEGFSFLWGHPALRRMGIANGFSNMGNAAFFGVAILFYIGPYDLPTAGFGAALGLLALGGVVGALVADKVVGRIGHRQVLLLGAATFGVGYALIALSSNPWIAGATLSVLGVTGMVWNTSNRVARQVLTPEPLLGRVTSVMRVTALTASPLGAVLGGLMAEAFGLRSIAWISVGAFGGAVILLSRIPAEALNLTSDAPPSEPQR